MTIAERPSIGPSLPRVMEERARSFQNQLFGHQYIVDRQPLGQDPYRSYEANLPVFVSVEGGLINFMTAAEMVVESARVAGRVARVLDIGCGQGILSRFLKEQFDEAVEAVGVSSIDFRTESQRQEAQKLGITYLIYDAQTLANLDQGQFDLIVSVKAIEHMTDQLAVLEGAYNILRPNGFAFLDIEDLYWRFDPRTDYKKFVAFLGENYDIQVSYRGIAFQKTRAGQLELPLTYAGLLHRSNNTAVATYSFDDPERQPVQPTRAFAHCG